MAKLAPKPGILDPFHFRELCHMLTVIHEALLAQRGVWQNGWEVRCGGEVGVDRGWYKHWDVPFTYKHGR